MISNGPVAMNTLNAIQAALCVHLHTQCLRGSLSVMNVFTTIGANFYHTFSYLSVWHTHMYRTTCYLDEYKIYRSGTLIWHIHSISQ